MRLWLSPLPEVGCMDMGLAVHECSKRQMNNI